MLAETRARTLVLINECQRLRLQSAQRQRESLELRNACMEAGQACRSSIEQSRARCHSQTRSHDQRVDVARWIAKELSSVGLSAFVFEPSHDTALRS